MVCNPLGKTFGNSVMRFYLDLLNSVHLGYQNHRYLLDIVLNALASGFFNQVCEMSNSTGGDVHHVARADFLRMQKPLDAHLNVTGLASRSTFGRLDIEPIEFLSLSLPEPVSFPILI